MQQHTERFAREQPESMLREIIFSNIASHRNLSADLFADALLADLYARTAASDGHGQEGHITLLVVDFAPLAT